MKTVFVVGAGPAGFYAAQKIAKAGHAVALFNRDIKPGGLAEYGIYPAKEKMKAGLRKQFGKILGIPHTAYFGNVSIGDGKTLSIGELADMNPAAIVFAVGAQGTKKLGIAGEDAGRVYAAKDFVYHYNLLPPFATQDFSVGKRVAIVGMGNVMVDNVRWLSRDDPAHAAEEITVVARRGPFEAKFGEDEFEHIEAYLDIPAMREELARVRERLEAVGQDIVKVAETTFPTLAKSNLAAAKTTQAPAGPKLRFRFLSSSLEIRPGADGRITRLTVAENILAAKGEGLSAKATDKTSELEVDTLIFAVGDVVDPTIGLPVGKTGYATNPDTTDPERAAYEIFDPASSCVREGEFAVGWARKASDGLVGLARLDAEKGATHVLAYLEKAGSPTTASAEDIEKLLSRKGAETVGKADIPYLATAEEKQALERNLPSFKFATNEEMLSAIEAEKSGKILP